MNLPRLFVLTDRRQSESAGRPLSETVAAVVEAGAPAIVLREKDLPAADRERLAHDVLERVAAGGAALIVASDPDLAARVGADGIHLAVNEPLPTGASFRSVGDEPLASPPALARGLLGRSCHHLDEVAAAQGQPLTYLTVSPVYPTASKPGYGPALGPAGIGQAAAVSAIPVLALGGVEPAHVPELLAAGAHGAAVMGAVMRADDPASVIVDFQRALGVPR